MEDLVILETRNGRGVFAAKNFKKKEKILEFHGKLFAPDKLPNPYNDAEDGYIQISPKKYLGPSGNFDDFVNHSCDPNSGIKIRGKKVVLIAIKDIKKGEEITFDFSTTTDESGWEKKCNCGSKDCRKIIRDFKHLPKSVQKKYIKLGIVPNYVTKKSPK